MEEKVIKASEVIKVFNQERNGTNSRIGKQRFNENEIFIRKNVIFINGLVAFFFTNRERVVKGEPSVMVRVDEIHETKDWYVLTQYYVTGACLNEIIEKYQIKVKTH